MISFGSDNHSGIHPEFLQAMQEANTDSAASYGQDLWSQRLKKRCKDVFGACDSFLVFNGTAANVLCLQVGLQSFESVLVTDVAHIHVDECGAPEKVVGCKVLPVNSEDGKFRYPDLKAQIIRQGDQHFSQVKMVSVTQPTEYGTLYTLAELQDIRRLCDEHGLYLHIDGARFANAAQAMNMTLGDLAQCADLLSFGGTKNGMLAGEIVVVRKPELAKNFRFYRKQLLQLPSKTRFFAAPFLKYLDATELWRQIAQHENQKAQELKTLLLEKTPLKITRPTQANSVFCTMPRAWVKALRKSFFFYVWNEATFEVRLMTSFDTTSAHIADFVRAVQDLALNTSGLSSLPLNTPLERL